jgi:protein-S-isoprenylcysteine O-methyltransferase Ste14
MSTQAITVDALGEAPRSECPIHAIRDAFLDTAASAPARLGVFIYGVIAYAAFFGAFAYAIGFVGNWIVPKSIDSGVSGALIPSLAINGAILVLFVVQHTIMARPWFKRWVTKFIPVSMERSTFVLLASAILMLLFWQWRPQTQVVWNVEPTAARWALSGLSLAGFGLVFVASFMVSHFDLFGLRQVWTKFRNRSYQPIGFRVVGIYKLVRHPLMTGFLIAFWATPTMTVGHLFFAIMTTGYILFGTTIEERDLIAHFGDRYRQYKRTVPGLIPRPRFSR